MSYRQSVMNEFAREFDVDRLYLSMTFLMLFGWLGVITNWMLSEMGATPAAAEPIATAVQGIFFLWAALGANIDKLLAISIRQYLYKGDTSGGEAV